MNFELMFLADDREVGECGRAQHTREANDLSGAEGDAMLLVGVVKCEKKWRNASSKEVQEIFKHLLCDKNRTQASVCLVCQGHLSDNGQ